MQNEVYVRYLGVRYDGERWLHGYCVADTMELAAGGILTNEFEDELAYGLRVGYVYKVVSRPDGTAAITDLEQPGAQMEADVGVALHHARQGALLQRQARVAHQRKVLAMANCVRCKVAPAMVYVVTGFGVPEGGYCMPCWQQVDERMRHEVVDPANG